MQMLNRIIPLPLSLMLCICSCTNAQTNLHRKGHAKLSCELIGFKFVNLKKSVWVCAPKNQIAPETTGIKKSEYADYKYEVTDFYTINFPPALFENRNGELFINGLKLEKYGTAIVEKDGSVSIGQFPSFEIPTYSNSKTR